MQMHTRNKKQRDGLNHKWGLKFLLPLLGGGGGELTEKIQLFCGICWK